MTLIIIILVVIIGVKVIQRISKQFDKSFYNVSFNEGISLHMLEVHSSEKIEMIERDKNLKVSISQPNENEFVYRLAFESKKQLQIMKEEIEKNKNVKKIDINYV